MNLKQQRVKIYRSFQSMYNNRLQIDFHSIYKQLI